MPGVAFNRASSDLRSSGGADVAGTASSNADLLAGPARSGGERGGEGGGGSRTSVEGDFDLDAPATKGAAATLLGAGGVDVTTSIEPSGLQASVTKLGSLSDSAIDDGLAMVNSTGCGKDIGLISGLAHPRSEVAVSPTDSTLIKMSMQNLNSPPTEQAAHCLGGQF